MISLSTSKFRYMAYLPSNIECYFFRKLRISATTKYRFFLIFQYFQGILNPYDSLELHFIMEVHNKAVTYIQNRHSYLSAYLEDGRCSFSNNLSENAIHPFTVDRKNWLFCDIPNAAQVNAVVYTMVEITKANGVNVYHYLTYLLKKLPDDRMSDDDLELLVHRKLSFCYIDAG